MMTDVINAETVAALLAICFVALALYLRARPRHRRGSRRSGTFSAWSFPSGKASRSIRAPVVQTAPDMRDPARQLHAIARVEFDCTPLLNRQEARLLPLLESAIRDLNAGHRVMAQTSLGELIRPKTDTASADDRAAAHASINSRRLDLAIIARSGRLAVAIEYQGGGHHQGTAFMRDAVKRDAIRRAGVPFIEVEPDVDPALLRNRITGRLTPAPTAAVVTDLRSRRV